MSDELKRLAKYIKELPPVRRTGGYWFGAHSFGVIKNLCSLVLFDLDRREREAAERAAPIDNAYSQRIKDLRCGRKPGTCRCQYCWAADEIERLWELRDKLDRRCSELWDHCKELEAANVIPWWTRFGIKPCVRIELRSGDKRIFHVIEKELTYEQFAAMLEAETRGLKGGA